MSTDPNDKLVEQARAGNSGALVALLEECGPVVRRRIASKIDGPMRSFVDEDDIMQITYLEAVLRFSTFTKGGTAQFTSWLSRLAENNLIDAARAMESGKRPDPRRRVTGSRNAADSMVALVELLGVTNTTPSVNAARDEAVGILEAALANLPPDYERVIKLYDLEGKEVGEVAKELGRSAGAVFMLRARAHDRLREILGSGSRFFSTGA